MIRSAEAKARDRASRAERYRQRYRSDPAFREQELARNRQNYKPRGTRAKPGSTLASRRRRERAEAWNKKRRDEYVPRPRVRRQPAPNLVNTDHGREVMAVWRQADPDSIIRQKYPNAVDVKAAIQKGEL